MRPRLFGCIGSALVRTTARLLSVICVALGLAAVGSVSATASGGAGYSAVAQFAVTHNPSGPWSYLLDGELFTHTGSKSSGSPECPCWWNGQQFPNGAVIGVNRGASPLKYETIVLPAGYVDMDPESTGNVGVRWTAPATGTFVITGLFLGVDVSEVAHMVGVYHDGASLYSRTISKYGQKAAFNLTVHVLKGGTIDFVSWSNGPSYLSTALQSVIDLK